jgi:hypothetical protein
VPVTALALLHLRVQVDSSSATWFPSNGERQVSQRLAEAAASGLQMLPEKLGQGQMSWQIIRGAAVHPAAAARAQQNGSLVDADSAAPSCTAGVRKFGWLPEGANCTPSVWWYDASKHRVLLQHADIEAT